MLICGDYMLTSLSVRLVYMNDKKFEKKKERKKKMNNGKEYMLMLTLCFNMDGLVFNYFT